MDKAPPRIGELLVKDGLITPDQLQEALEKQRSSGGKLVENLIALEYLDTQTFVRFLSKQPGTASIDLLNYTIPMEVIGLVERDFAIQHQLVPIDKMGRDLTVGMACPLDARTVTELEQMTGMKVRPLLVSMSDVRTALKNYYRIEGEAVQTFSMDDHQNLSLQARVVTPGTAPMAMVESGLKFEKVVHLIREISSLPALPETVTKVRDVMEDPNVSTDDVAVILGGDPPLAAKVVSLANSAVYAFTHHVDSIERATALLGLREVYSVVIGSAVIDYFKEGPHFDHKKFWKRSMICAAVSKNISKIRKTNGASGLFAAGLMYDLGRVVFAEIAPKQYAEVDQDLTEDEIIQIENEMFGLGHPEVGFLLADGWGLPGEITEPIRFHQDFQQAQTNPELVAIVAMGAVIADAMVGADPLNVRQILEEHPALMTYLALDEQSLTTVINLTRDAVQQQESDR